MATQQLPPPEVLYQLSLGDRSNPIIAVSILMIILSSILTILRTASQRLGKGKFDLDDLFIFLGWISALGCTIAGIISLKAGTGRHTLTILTSFKDPLNSLLATLKSGYASLLMWPPAMMFIKLALLFFYRRIFCAGAGSPRISAAIWAVTVYVTCVGVAITFNLAFQCTPADFFWIQAYLIAQQPPPKKGHCTLLVPRSIASQGLNISGDILVLLMPIWGVWSLQMSIERKIGFIGVFLLGSLTTVVSIVRIPYTLEASLSTSDAFWDNAWSQLFLILEVNTALICACLLGLRPLWKNRLRFVSYVTRGSYPRRGYQRSRDRPEDGGAEGNQTMWSVRRDITVRDESANSLTHLANSNYIPLDDLNESGQRAIPKAHTTTHIQTT